ncbi:MULTISPECIES: alpha/beta hydrolase [Aerosakkonema]|uniref:alpha/beta hydrolase n=1 Tax=Aerosakkonema TaxID=1246629 RepID=UPI0035B9128D
MSDQSRRTFVKASAIGAGSFLLSQGLAGVSNSAEAKMQNTETQSKGSYTMERVTFTNDGVELVGNLYIPDGLTQPAPALPILGPVAFVKEQSPVQYATRMAKEGFISLAFDPRFHGESGGEPRRYESPQAKVSDLKAAVSYLLTRPEVDQDRIYILGVCQGTNWAIQATTEDSRVKALALVAGHYLTKQTADEYNGGEEKTLARIERAKQAKAKYEETGEMEYIPIVSLEDPHALLLPKPIYEWYIRWANRGPAWNFQGLWENRITAMSEAELWTYRVDETIKNLNKPTLMVHADKAATGPVIPKKIFESIPAKDKELVWLGDKIQFQFYEEPETIDKAAINIAAWFNRHV